MEPRIGAAFDAMAALEGGAIANPDERRMVGPLLAARPGARAQARARREIEATLAPSSVRRGRARGPRAARAREHFRNVLVVGIGGSALGPQFVADALGSAPIRMQPFFLDNTDPDGIDRRARAIGAGLAETLTVVISKSGGTKETRNGMLEAQAAYAAAGFDSPARGGGHRRGQRARPQAREAGWLARFPMWDWVGGRTSELSAVGLLPAALQGIDDRRELLAGAGHGRGHPRRATPRATRPRCSP